MSDVTYLRESWPPVRSRGIDLSGSTYALLEAAGIVRRTDLPGSFALMPLGVTIRDRMVRIIERAFRECGFVTVMLPSLQSRAVWERSGRWAVYARDGSLFRVTGRREDQEYCLAPTSEEIAVLVTGSDLRSYRDLPVRIALTTPKFRDEISPRGGLLRAREFEMADAYTFDATTAGMHESISRLNRACRTALARMGFTGLLEVPADGGDISQAPSTEHVVYSDAGQSDLLECDGCGYRGDAAVITAAFSPGDEGGTVKMVAFRCGERVVCVGIRADLEVSTRKVVAAIGARAAGVLPAGEFSTVFGVEPHRLGPASAAASGAELLFDASVVGLRDFTVATPDGLAHGVNWGDEPAGGDPGPGIDLHRAAEGLLCGRCRTRRLRPRRAIELGHVFELGERYSGPMGLRFTGSDGRSHTPVMACSGIGVGRCLQALAELRRDERGLRWPAPVAPARLHVIPLTNDPGAVTRVVGTAVKAGASVIVDDRDVSAGERFRYAWALGLPAHVVIADHGLEWVDRGSGDQRPISYAELPALVGAGSA